MNPADLAQVEAAKANAEMARRDAGLLMQESGENARMFTSKAEQRLAQGVAILGKTGSLAGTRQALPTARGELGSLDTKEVEDLRSSIPNLQKTLADTPETVTTTYTDEQGVQQTRTDPNPAFKEAQDALNLAESNLETIGAPGGGAAEIREPDAMAYATGSDLLTLVTTRDAMERDKRTLMRSAQNDAMAMLKSGENYDTAADYARQAASWNAWNSVLGTGLKIAGTVAMF